MVGVQTKVNNKTSGLQSPLFTSKVKTFQQVCSEVISQHLVVPEANVLVVYSVGAPLF